MQQGSRARCPAAGSDPGPGLHFAGGPPSGPPPALGQADRPVPVDGLAAGPAGGAHHGGRPAAPSSPGSAGDRRGRSRATAGAGAAVLIALMPRGRARRRVAASVVLIRRAAHLRANPGEIAFPGGRIEPGEVPLQAALREAEEEVGLSPDGLEVLGELSSLGHPLGVGPDRPLRGCGAGSRLSSRRTPTRSTVSCACRSPRSSLLAATGASAGTAPVTRPVRCTSSTWARTSSGARRPRCSTHCSCACCGEA